MNKRIPIFLSLTALLLSGCAGSQKPQPAETTVVTVQPPVCTHSQTEETAGAVEPQLMALTDTEKAAWSWLWTGEACWAVTGKPPFLRWRRN